MIKHTVESVADRCCPRAAVLRSEIIYAIEKFF
jgi:hypothetical protein